MVGCPVPAVGRLRQPNRRIRGGRASTQHERARDKGSGSEGGNDGSGAGDRRVAR